MSTLITFMLVSILALAIHLLAPQWHAKKYMAVLFVGAFFINLAHLVYLFGVKW